MGTVTVRQLDDATKLRLRIQAAQKGHSMEQEARNILQAALAPPPTVPQGNWVDQLLRQFAEIGPGGDLLIPPREIVEPRVTFDE